MRKSKRSSKGISTITNTQSFFSFCKLSFLIENSIDTDGSGKIDYTEFLAATMEKSLYMKEDKLI